MDLRGTFAAGKGYGKEETQKEGRKRELRDLRSEKTRKAGALYVSGTGWRVVRLQEDMGECIHSSWGEKCHDLAINVQNIHDCRRLPEVYPSFTLLIKNIDHAHVHR